MLMVLDAGTRACRFRLSSYDKYLEHIQRNHPDKQVQSRGDFLTEVFTSVLNQLFFYKF